MRNRSGRTTSRDRDEDPRDRDEDPVPSSTRSMIAPVCPRGDKHEEDEDEEDDEEDVCLLGDNTDDETVTRVVSARDPFFPRLVFLDGGSSVDARAEANTPNATPISFSRPAITFIRSPPS